MQSTAAILRLIIAFIANPLYPIGEDPAQATRWPGAVTPAFDTAAGIGHIASAAGMFGSMLNKCCRGRLLLLQGTKRMNKVKVGVIGLGMGRVHLECYEACPNAQVVALCDIDEAKLSKDLEKRPGVKGFTDYREMLRMEGLEAVSVALPNFLHAPVTLDALNAGKHVLCEKPMAMNAGEARQMKQTAEKLGKILMMHFNMRYMATAATLKPLIDAGVLGEVYHVTTSYTRRDGYPRQSGWFGVKSQSGGGPLIDLGVHRIDLALWLIGYPTPATVLGSVYDLLAREKQKGGDFDCEDFSAALIRFENGCTMYVVASWDGHEQQPFELTMSIRGNRGAVFESGGKLTLCRTEHGVPTVSALEQQQAKESAQQHFVNCIQEGRQPGPSAEHGVVVMGILDAVYESARTGREVRIR